MAFCQDHSPSRLIPHAKESSNEARPHFCNIGAPGMTFISDSSNSMVSSSKLSSKDGAQRYLIPQSEPLSSSISSSCALIAAFSGACAAAQGLSWSLKTQSLLSSTYGQSLKGLAISRSGGRTSAAPLDLRPLLKLTFDKPRLASRQALGASLRQL